MSTPIERAAEAARVSDPEGDAWTYEAFLAEARAVLSAALDVDELAHVLRVDDEAHRETETSPDIFRSNANAIVAHLLGQYDFFQDEHPGRQP